MRSLAAEETSDSGWQAQLSQVRRWYQPHLERLYDGLDTREADLEQLEQISGRYPTRERFLTELTLDPPSAAGDLAGDPRFDSAEKRGENGSELVAALDAILVERAAAEWMERWQPLGIAASPIQIAARGETP